MEPESYLGTDGVPEDAPFERIDAVELPPPEPLTKTLETLAELDDRTVLVQSNDRAPQHLYPKLEERGYDYVTHDESDRTVTVIWKPD
ncbi:MAG: TusA-related sulfurtransferase [Methanobacteriota archaeon]|jgi:TusA-related sulfurtransferase